jgi:uncharacterized iron-regulated protein
MPQTYEQLKARVLQLRQEGRVQVWPTDEERIDWVYGNTKIENEDITREMVEQAVVRQNAERHNVG